MVFLDLRHLVLIFVLSVGINVIPVAAQMTTVTAQTEKEIETEENSVKATFYGMSLSQWEVTVRTTFTTHLVKQANDFCSSFPQECQLDTWTGNSTFAVSNLKYLAQSQDKSYVEIEYALELPTGSDLINGSSTKYMLNKKALTAITLNVRKGFNQDTGYSVVEVEGERYNLPPNDLLNAIISPIACVILVLVAVIVIVLHFIHKRRAKQDRKNKQRRQAPKKQQVGPSPPEKYGDEAHLNGKSAKWAINDETRGGPVKPYHGGYEGATNKNYFRDSPDTRGQPLPPLPKEDEDREPAKKHKKKKKKSKKHEYDDNVPLDDNTHVIHYQPPQYQQEWNISSEQPKPLQKRQLTSTDSENDEHHSPTMNTTNTEL